MKLNSILLAGALVLTGSIGAGAQATNGVGIHFGAYDFYGPQTDKYFGSDQYRYEYNDEKNGYDTTTATNWFWRPMVKVSYWKEITPNVSLSGAISVASLEYPTGNPDST